MKYVVRHIFFLGKRTVYHLLSQSQQIVFLMILIVLLEIKRKRKSNLVNGITTNNASQDFFMLFWTFFYFLLTSRMLQCHEWVFRLIGFVFKWEIRIYFKKNIKIYSRFELQNFWNKKKRISDKWVAHVTNNIYIMDKNIYKRKFKNVERSCYVFYAHPNRDVQSTTQKLFYVAQNITKI